MAFVWYGGTFEAKLDPAPVHDFQLVVDPPADATLMRTLIWYECSEILYQTDDEFTPNWDATVIGVYWRSGFVRDVPEVTQAMLGDNLYNMGAQGVNWDFSLSHDATQAYSGGGDNGPNNFGTRIVLATAPRDGRGLDLDTKFLVARNTAPSEAALWCSIGPGSFGGPGGAERTHTFYCTLSFRVLFLQP